MKDKIQKIEQYFSCNFTDFPKQEVKYFRIGESVLIADLHTPYHNRNNLEKIIEVEGGAENLFILGDYFDFASKSRFIKTHSPNFREEFRVGYELLKNLSTYFKNIYYLMGNHDDRFVKWLYNNIPIDIIDLIDVNILEKLIKLIPNIKILRTRLNNRYIDYAYLYKNVLLTHIGTSNKDIMKTVQTIYTDKLSRWGEYLNFYNYDIVIQAHNHVSGRIRFGKKWLFQIPCLIDINLPAFDYIFTDKMIGNPPINGYMKLFEKNGKIDPFKIQLIDID